MDPQADETSKKISGHDKMGRRKIEGLICTRCNRDFSQEPYGTTAFKRHIARKNPCVPEEGHTYQRAPPKFFEGVVINDFDAVDLSHVTAPTPDGRKEVWIRSFLRQIFSREENKCIVLKNIEMYPDEIFVKREGKVRVMSIHNLTILTLLVLHERLYPYLEISGWDKYKEFEEWVDSVSGVALNDRSWAGTIEPLSYYYIFVRDFLKDYLFKMENRRHQTWMISSATWSP